MLPSKQPREERCLSRCTLPPAGVKNSKGSRTAGEPLSEKRFRESRAAPKPKRQKIEMRSLQRRDRYSAASALEEDSFLATHAVAPPSLAKYLDVLNIAVTAAQKLGLTLDASNEKVVDVALCEVADLLFFDGEDSHVGHTLLAAWMHQHPEYGRFGSQHLPRFHRALKGWDRLAPGGTRLPEAWPVWAALALWFLRQGLKWMGVCVLVMFGTYGRPGEISELRGASLVPPSKGISKHWAFVIRPHELGRPTKTGRFNDVVIWDVHGLNWVNKLFEELRNRRNSQETLWPFTDGEFLKKFNQGAAELGVPWLSRYHARHSGASWDALQKHRTLQEVQQRGRWVSFSSVTRYEKGGRIQMQWQSLNPKFRAFADVCARRIEQCFLGCAPVPMPPSLPPSRSWRTSLQAAAGSRAKLASKDVQQLK